VKNTFQLLSTFLILSAFGLWGCASYQNLSASQIAQHYSQSIVDASYPEADEISNDLVEIDTDNRQLVWKEINGEQHMLVATWTANTTYYPQSGDYNTGNYPIWVTAAPELLNWYRSRKPQELSKRDLRLKQLLGLPPNVEKNYFVEFWVRPGDLFRPCPDKEVTDSSCGLCFPDELDQEHKDWIRDLRNDSYYNCEGDKYPWTQLGYTYDWYPGNKSHIGLSEFVIGKNSDIVVNKIYTTKEYFQR